MKAVQYDRFSNDINDIYFNTSAPLPEASGDNVVVKVMAAAVNPMDWKVQHGMFKDLWGGFSFMFTMGYEFAGTIHEISPSAPSTNFKAGDKVFAVQWGVQKPRGQHYDPLEDAPVGGAFAEYVLVPLSKLSRIPDGISFEKAAALPLAGTTAYEALFECVNLREGERILILGGSGAVGSIAIQLAKMYGASFVATTAPSRAVDYVNQFRVTDRVITCDTINWWEDPELKNIDVVFDAVCEQDAFEHAKKVLKSQGRFVTVSIGDPALGLDPTAHRPLEYAAWMCNWNDSKIQDKLIGLMAQGKLKMPIERMYEFTREGVLAMLERSEEGESLGKGVLNIALDS